MVGVVVIYGWFGCMFSVLLLLLCACWFTSVILIVVVILIVLSLFVFVGLLYLFNGFLLFTWCYLWLLAFVCCLLILF